MTSSLRKHNYEQINSPKNSVTNYIQLASNVKKLLKISPVIKKKFQTKNKKKPVLNYIYKINFVFKFFYHF